MTDVGTVSVDRGHIRYRAAGEGRPVVLLHGGGLDLRSWDDQVGPLSRAYRVVALDARGHGGSSTPTAPFRHCDDVAAVLRALDTGPATLVGLSLGGGTAVDTALERPEVVSALVVCGTGTSEPDFRDRWMADVFADLDAAETANDPDRWVAAFLRFAAGPRRGLDDVDPTVVDRLRTMATDTVTQHVSDDWVPATPVTDTWARAAGIGVPVLTISGSADADDHVRMAQQLADTVPHGTTATIEDTAHYPNMERPADFTAILEDFLREVT